VLKEANPFIPSLQEYTNQVAEAILEQTRGWFTKPLTSDWLLPRIHFSIPTDGVPASFEGTVTLETVRLVITKEQFVIECKVADMREAEKVIIDLQEDTPVVVNDVPFEPTTAAPIPIGPTRQVLQKRAVMEARSKAARALFKAEHMTQEYIQAYGEDTDWEEDDEGDSS